MEFKKLFEPMMIGKLRINNRICNAAQVTNFCTDDGFVTQRHIDYLEARAKAGAGLLFTEGTYPDPEKGRDFYYQMGSYDDKLIPQLKKLTDAVHKYDTRICMQIINPGREGDVTLTNKPVDAPSDVPCPIMGQIPGYKIEVMTQERIYEVIDTFVKGAVRAREAGFDLVEFHAAHGYLIEQFMSLLTNKRTDEFGCRSYEDRARFGVEIIRSVKKSLGDDFPVGIKMSVDEFVDGGLTLEDSKVFAKMFEDAGADFINVSAGMYPTFFLIIPTMGSPLAPLEPLAAGIREVVSVPVILVCRINDPVLAESILERGNADMISVGRGQLADPDWVRKAREGKEREIFHCIACNQACCDRLYSDLSVTCTVNPALGREKEYEIRPAEKKKKVLIIGGGPAGVQCAMVAGLRGHDVILYDRNEELGGNIRLAAKIPQRSEFMDLIRDMLLHIEGMNNVEIRLGQEAALSTIDEIKPDAVVVATGSEFIAPSSIPGIRRDDGRLAENVVMVDDVLEGRVQVGKEVVILGANSIGLELAEYLLEEKKNITVVERAQQPIQDILTNSTWPLLLRKLDEGGVRILTRRYVTGITSDEVVVDLAGRMPPYTEDGAYTGATDHEERIRCDTVIVALPRRPDDSLFRQLQGKFKEVYAIGDCAETGAAYRATGDGARVGRLL